jgi:hypothetical protein
MTITIPPELVPLLRDGLYSDLHTQLDLNAALIEPRDDRQSVRAEITTHLARADDTRALLDAVGWAEPVEASPVEVNVREHHDALLRGLLTWIEVERDLEDDSKASDAERAEAKVHVGQLADLIQRIEEVEVGSADHERGDFGTEHLLVMQLVFADRPEGRTRRELENLARDVDPEVIGDALRGLQAAGVVILDGERVRPSRCALRLDALGVICL